MSEKYKFDTFKKKLQGVCDENGLVFRFHYEEHPIALVIRPSSGVSEQMSMLMQADEVGYKSPNASIVFEFRDGELFYKTAGNFTLDDALFNKVKNLAKNMHYLWLQHFFHTVITKVKTGVFAGLDSLPVIEDSDPTRMGGDTDGETRTGEPLEVGDAPDLDDAPELEDEDVLGSLSDVADGDDDAGETADGYPFEEGAPDADEA